jgi:hypothetical protein
LLELASCAYLNRAEDIILAGPIGTGNYRKNLLMERN